MPLARIRVSPYSLPSHSSIHPTISSSIHRVHPRRLAILLLVALITLYYLSSHHSTLYIEIPPELVSNSLQLSSLLSPHNDSHSLLRTPTPLLHSSDPSFTFSPRSPCNSLTLSLSLSNSSQLQSWLSPTPPLPPNSTLSNRITSFLSAPLGSVQTHKKWNQQVCSNENPSIKWNTNQLHSRENRDWWDTLSDEEVRGKRRELVSVLERARKEGRIDEFGGEIRRSWDEGGGRGLVWTAGNADTFDRVLVSLRLLREHYSCSLPAEIFHFPSETPSPTQLTQFTSLNASLISLPLTKSTHSKSFHIKGFSLTSSKFSQILYLDSDSLPTRNPEFLFESPEFREMGAVFWMDYWRDTGENGIWRLLGIQCRDEMGMESGQVLIDKRKHMDALVLLEHFLGEWKYWFRFSDGDKDLLRYAFLLLRKRWAVPSHSITPASWKNPLEVGEGNKERFAGHTMLQFGLGSELWDASEEERKRGRVLFVHANLIKRITGEFNQGSTWGRSLELTLPPPSSSNSSSTRRTLTADDLANVSPYTGIGIPSYYNTSSTPPDLETRQRLLLERGMRTDFWDGHRGVNYVLAIEQTWEDDLNSVEVNTTRRSASDEWLKREGEAECTMKDEIREETLRTPRLGEGEGDNGEGGEKVERGFMRVVDWDSREELREFEKRFYQAGGKANGLGF